jgi:hypothetical protein
MAGRLHGFAAMRDVEREGTITLARALMDRLSRLARADLELAEREVRAHAHLGRTAGVLAIVAAAAAAAALTCALIAAVEALRVVVPGWAVPLVGSALFAVTSALVLRRAIRVARAVRPRRAIREARATLGLLTRSRTER